MAQRFKAEQLKEMIRVLVREEIRSVVKETINEVLSERYLQKLAEVAASRPRGVGRTMHIADGDDQEDEGTPEILRNDSDGIYTKHPMKHSDGLEDDEPEQLAPVSFVPEGMERNEMISLMFEGTRPINEIDAEVGVVEGQEDEGVPVMGMQQLRPPRVRQRKQQGQLGFGNNANPEGIRALIGLKEGKTLDTADRRIAEGQVAMEERRLEQYRKSLERK